MLCIHARHSAHIYYLESVYTYMPQDTRFDYRTACQFFPSTMQFLGIELRLLTGLAASTFTHWDIFQPHLTWFKSLIRKCVSFGFKFLSKQTPNHKRIGSACHMWFWWCAFKLLKWWSVELPREGKLIKIKELDMEVVCDYRAVIGRGNTVSECKRQLSYPWF